MFHMTEYCTEQGCALDFEIILIYSIMRFNEYQFLVALAAHLYRK